MTTSQHVDPLIGKLVDNRYRVRARVARGGMATVYVATDMRLERRVALKVMHHHLSDDDRFQSRFIQEARTAARLSDAHVVNVFDQGQDGEIAYLVMEYLPGITLRDLLKEQRRLTIVQIVTVMDAVLQGLAAAHRDGLIHRDVKPENVLLAEDGRIKIGDFGLARVATANTGSGQQLLGTIAYLAPEMFTKGTADTRSDIYSLGIMLYEMLVGEQPYRGDAPMQVAFQHANDSVPRPSARNPSVPEQLDELVLWATEKDPDERPDDAMDMLRRLREIEQQLGVTPIASRSHSHPVVSADADHDVEGHTRPFDDTDLLTDGADTGPTTVFDGTTTGTIATSNENNSTRLQRLATRRTRRTAWLILVTVVLAALAGGAGWWWGSGPGSQVSVPQLAGLTSAEASATLSEHELFANVTEEDHLNVPAGVVIRSEPDAGTRVDRDTDVTVVLSTGPAEVTLTDFSGMSTDAVRESLDDAIITVSEDASEIFTDSDAGSIVAVQITPASGGEAIDCTTGCSAHQGDTAQLTTSVGPLPNPVGKTLDDATAELDAVGVGIEVIGQDYSREVAEGSVISYQERDGGGSWQPGDTVRVVTSLGVPLVTVPDVSGMTLENAKAALEAVGLVATYWSTWDAFAAVAVVSSYSPPAGESVREGSEIELQLTLTG